MSPDDCQPTFQDRLRSYVRDRLVPAESSVAETGVVPPEIVKEMRALGLFGLTIPRAYGGAGYSSHQEVEAVVTLTWASAVFRSVVGVNMTIGSQAIALDGTDAQKTDWLPRIASGDVISCFAMSEPDAGSDAAGMSTRADRDGAGYRLNGAKRFITNASHAGLLVTLARTADRQKDNSHISAFLIPRDTAGVSIGPADQMMGQAGANSAPIRFEAAWAPQDALLGETEGQGFRTAMKVLDRSRIHIAAVCVGQARRILHEALQHSLSRHQYGKALARLQLVQAMLADSQAELYAAESMTRAAARDYDEGRLVTRQAACCKMYASEMLGRVADRAVQILGGDGYMRGQTIERFYRDARLFRIYEGATQVQQVVIARDMAATGAVT